MNVVILSNEERRAVISDWSMSGLLPTEYIERMAKGNIDPARVQASAQVLVEYQDEIKRAGRSESSNMAGTGAWTDE